MTLESWSMGIVRPVMEQYPYAWVFFVPFILIATFTMLNLFIGVVVSAIQSQHDAAVADLPRPEDELRREIGELRQELRELRGLLASSTGKDGHPPP
jgi:voltage-gated sodium channel